MENDSEAIKEIAKSCFIQMNKQYEDYLAAKQVNNEKISRLREALNDSLNKLKEDQSFSNVASLIQVYSDLLDMTRGNLVITEQYSSRMLDSIGSMAIAFGYTYESGTSTDYRTFLMEMRARKGLCLDELASRVGISMEALCEIESGKTVPPIEQQETLLAFLDGVL